jgi:glycosyltransferase involved in cell wall biosynthesis
MPIRSAVSAEPRRLEGHAARAPDAPAPRRPTSVLHVIAPGAVGGAESVVRTLAAAQRDIGINVSVAAVVQPGEPTPLLDALRDASIDAHRITVPSRGYRVERRSLAALCASLSPSVVHTHGYRADVVDAAYLQQRGLPIVTTVHGFTGGDLRNRCYQWLQCRAYRQFDAVAVVSSPLQRQLADLVLPHRLHIVPNAFRAGPIHSRGEARAALGLPHDAFIIGWVGRLSREKGADVLLRAMADLSVPTVVHAAIIGDGPEHISLRRQAMKLRLAERVSWHGRVANAERYFAAFDTFVLSSRTEGTPMVLFEAMAAGVPVIATSVGGVPDVLTPGTGLLVPSESPHELGTAIRRVLLERAAAAARARAASVRVTQTYGVTAWAARYDNIYRFAGDSAGR